MNLNLFTAKVHPGMPESRVAFAQTAVGLLNEALEHGTITDHPVRRVELMADGQASLVYRLTDTVGADWILKVAGEVAVLEAEAAYLTQWQQIGIRTPKVFKCATLGGARGVPYLLMEFLPGTTLRTVLQRHEIPHPSTNRDLGMILATMHSAKAQGYGTAGNGNLHIEKQAVIGRFDSLRQQMAEEDLPGAIEFVLQHKLLTDSDLSRLNEAVDILDQCARSSGPSLSHTDFRAGNILYDPTLGNPYAVIDPYPSATHPYLDVAYTTILDEIDSGQIATDFVAGYAEARYGGAGGIDHNVLDSAILLQAVRMAPSFASDRDSSYAVNLSKVISRMCHHKR